MANILPFLKGKNPTVRWCDGHLAKNGTHTVFKLISKVT